MAHPGVAAELDHPEVATLIAPRPLMLMGSPEDWLFPWDAVQASWGRVAREWAGPTGRFTTQVTAGGHRFNEAHQATAAAWLKRHT